MKKILIFVLSLLVIASSLCLAEEDTYTSYTEHTLANFSFTLPVTIQVVDLSKLNCFYCVDNEHFLRVGSTYTDLGIDYSSDSSFSEYCIYTSQGGENPETVTTLFPAPEGCLKAGVVAYEGEYTYFAIGNNGIISIETVGYSSSVDLQLAFMQIISSLSCTPSEE